MTIKQIIVFREKHGDAYYDASTPDAITSAMLAVLRSRDGYYYSEPGEFSPYLPDEDKDLLKLSDEQVKALPESLRSKILKVKSYYASCKKEHDRDIFWWKNLRRVLDSPVDEAKEMFLTLKNRDGTSRQINAVRYLMDQVANSEYEGYSIERLEEVA